MRLGVNGRFLAAPVTGVQRFAREVIARIACQADVTLFLPHGAEALPNVAEVVRGRLRGHAFEQLELPRMAASGCDVLLDPANTAPLTRTPFVLVLHDVLPLTNPLWFSRRFALWSRLQVPRAARAAARVVTVSAWCRREICRATGVAPGRVVVAPQGLSPFDSPAAEDAVQRVRERYRLPARFLLAVGDNPRKNIGFLKAVLERWSVQYDDAPLLVLVAAGARSVHQRARRSARWRGGVDDAGTRGGVACAGRRGGVDDAGRRGVAEPASTRVIAYDAVDDAELHALYTAACLLCFPSHAEGFGRPPLEAIACGTPAIVAPHAAAHEVLGGVRAARIVPLDLDAWVEEARALVHHPFGRVGLAEDGVALRKRWTWDAAADVVLDCCHAALRPARRSYSVRDVSAATPRVPTADQPRDAHSGSPSPRIAIVHDWLTGMRGGERVLEALLMLYPTADVFTLVHVPASVSPVIEAHVIRTSFVDRLPRAHTAYRSYLPLYRRAVERFDLAGYDLVLSSSHCAAKGVRAQGAPHLCYCHTPMRYIWDRSADYFGPGRAAAPMRLAMAVLAPRLRAWDVETALAIDHIVANSRHVRDRILTCWRRDAVVVHPPVDVDRFEPAAQRDDHYAIAGALVPYKRVDLAIQVFNLLGRRLLVIGDGPEYARLRALAGPSIEFTGRVPDDEMARLLARARGLIMPMVEDFGIIAVEAQAAGTPVIAFAAGGARETVVGWRADRSGDATGVFFHEQSTAALAAAVLTAEEIQFDVEALRRNARRFAPDVFFAAMRAQVAGLLAAAGERRLASGR